MAGRFSVEAVFKAVDRVTAPVNRMQQRMRKFTRSMTRGLRGADKAFGKMVRGIKVGAKIAAASLATLSVAIFDVVRTGADFGRAIGSAAAKFPEQIKRGTAEFKALEDAARDVGSTTEFTSTQAAQGLNFLAKAGFSAAAAVKALPGIVDFATAAEIDFAEAADVASDALGAFGLDSTDLGKKMKGLQRVMDVMSLTANSTNVSVAELFESVKGGGPVAAAAGVSIETFAASMGFLANSGIKASKAGTDAKNITLALAGVGNKAASVFKKLGISLADSSGNLRDQFDIMDELRGKLGKFGEIQRVQLVESIFGKIPLASASKLLSDTEGSVRALRKSLEAAGGSSKKTAAFIRNDVRGSLDSLSSAIEGVKISIFSAEKGPLKAIIDRMTEWIRLNEGAAVGAVIEGIEFLINNRQQILDTATTILKVTAAVVAVSLVLKTLIAVMTLVNLVMLANPVGLLVAGVLLLIAAFAALVIWSEDIAVSLDKMTGVAWLVTRPLAKLVDLINFIKGGGDVGASFAEGLDNMTGIAWLLTRPLAKLVELIRSIDGAAIGAGFSAVTDFLGFTGNDVPEVPMPAPVTRGERDDAEPRARAPVTQMVSPQDRVARTIEERRETSTAEVTIRDETNRAEVTGGKLGPSIQLQSSGAL